MKVMIVNGPNLNLLGTREPDIYGSVSFIDYLKELKKDYPGIEIEYFQSNIEGELIDTLHNADIRIKGFILNAGGYTHTSVALGDAVKAIKSPVIEVHLSNVMNRESFRHISYISPAAEGVISGFGLKSYNLALDYFQKYFGG